MIPVRRWSFSRQPGRGGRFALTAQLMPWPWWRRWGRGRGWVVSEVPAYTEGDAVIFSTAKQELARQVNTLVSSHAVDEGNGEVVDALLSAWREQWLQSLATQHTDHQQLLQEAHLSAQEAALEAVGQLKLAEGRRDRAQQRLDNLSTQLKMTSAQVQELEQLMRRETPDAEALHHQLRHQWRSPLAGASAGHEQVHQAGSSEDTTSTGHGRDSSEDGSDADGGKSRARNVHGSIDGDVGGDINGDIDGTAGNSGKWVK